MRSDQPAGAQVTGGPVSATLTRMVGLTTVLVVFGVFIAGLSHERLPRSAFAASPVAIPPGACTLPATGATPVAAEPDATPGVPTDAVGDVPVQITSAIANLAACWQDQNWDTGLALVTDRYLTTNFGTTDRAVVLATLKTRSAAGLAGTVSLDTVADIRTQGIGFASAAVTWRQGYAFRFDRWRFVVAQNRWLLDEIALLDPPETGSAVGIEAVIEVDGLKLSRGQVVDPGSIVIHVVNPTNQAMILLVFRSLGTAELRDRLAGARPSSGNAPFVGDVTVAAREEADLILIDLPPDTYTIVASSRQPGGTLDIRDAYTATLAVADA